MNTGNIKQFIGVAAISLLTACGSPVPDAALLQPGVSRELAQFRKEHFKEVRYNLFFSIPESREEAVTGKADITLAIHERLPVIIDFRGESEQVASVLLNGRKVPYTVKDEHIVIDTREAADGENRVTIEFTANDQSLNRRDEFLYTLLVPDRARTLFPLFRPTGHEIAFHPVVGGSVFLAGARQRGGRAGGFDIRRQAQADFFPGNGTAQHLSFLFCCR